MTDGDEVATRLEHEMAVGSGAAQRLQRPTRPMPEGKTAWRRRERDVVTRRSDACARARRAEGDNRTHQHTLENFSSGVQPEWRKTHGPDAGRCSAGRPRLGGAGDASVAGRDGRCGVHRACSPPGGRDTPQFLSLRK